MLSGNQDGIAWDTPLLVFIFRIGFGLAQMVRQKRTAARGNGPVIGSLHLGNQVLDGDTTQLVAIRAFGAPAWPALILAGCAENTQAAAGQARSGGFPCSEKGGLGPFHGQHDIKQADVTG